MGQDTLFYQIPVGAWSTSLEWEVQPIRTLMPARIIQVCW